MSSPNDWSQLALLVGALLLLLQHRGKVLTHRQLLRDAWGPALKTDTHYLRVHMANLCKTVEAKPEQPQFVKTESGGGYRFTDQRDPPLTLSGA